MRKSRSSDFQTSPESAPRRRLPPAERRASILAAALPCFAERGYLGAGTRDLAKAAGVTEPILYRHFADKADLFGAVLGRSTERLSACVEEATAGAETADARLAALAEALPRIIDTCRAELRVLTAGALVTGHPEIADATAAAIEELGRVLARAFEGKGLRAGIRPETAGFLLLEIGLGASMMRPLGVTSLTAEGYGAQAVDVLLRGLAR